MKPLLRATAGAAMAMGAIVSSAGSATAWPVDCAILLCLAGGWPASTPCAEARAVFIQRITPFPVEPPLQIWNCPMAARAVLPPAGLRDIVDISYARPANAVPAEGYRPFPTQADRGADIDLSSDAFDFVRSIRVYHIRYSHRRNRYGNCQRQDSTMLGTYDARGAFSWQESAARSVPAASGYRSSSGCLDDSYRAVFVDWLDQAGSYGFVEVRY